MNEIARTKDGHDVRILVAEDSDVIRRLVHRALSKRGHQVDSVEDGEAALSRLRSTPYDVALVDFHLPKIDGVRLASVIRTEGRHNPQVRFVALTADVKGLLAHPESRDTFDLVIAKPIDLIHLCEVIESLLEIPGWQQDETRRTPVPIGDASDERRLHRRAGVDRGTTRLTIESGPSFNCKVINLSLGGAAVEVDVRPPIGSTVIVDHTPGRVVRHTEKGLAIEFTRVR